MHGRMKESKCLNPPQALQMYKQTFKKLAGEKSFLLVQWILQGILCSHVVRLNYMATDGGRKRTQGQGGEVGWSCSPGSLSFLPGRAQALQDPRPNLLWPGDQSAANPRQRSRGRSNINFQLDLRSGQDPPVGLSALLPTSRRARSSLRPRPCCTGLQPGPLPPPRGPPHLFGPRPSGPHPKAKERESCQKNRS